MKFGVCRCLDDFESIKIASEVGIDYYECGFGSLANYDGENLVKDFVWDEPKGKEIW